VALGTSCLLDSSYALSRTGLPPAGCKLAALLLHAAQAGRGRLDSSLISGFPSQDSLLHYLLLFSGPWASWFQDLYQHAARPTHFPISLHGMDTPFLCTTLCTLHHPATFLSLLHTISPLLALCTPRLLWPASFSLRPLCHSTPYFTLPVLLPTACTLPSLSSYTPSHTGPYLPSLLLPVQLSTFLPACQLARYHIPSVTCLLSSLLLRTSLWSSEEEGPGTHPAPTAPLHRAHIPRQYAAGDDALGGDLLPLARGRCAYSPAAPISGEQLRILTFPHALQEEPLSARARTSSRDAGQKRNINIEHLKVGARERALGAAHTSIRRLEGGA